MYIKSKNKLWVKVRAVFILLILCSLSIHLYIFANHETLMASYTPATENELYCTLPTITEFKHEGYGEINFNISGIIEKIHIENYNAKIIKNVDGISLKIQLLNGFNSIQLNINDKISVLNIMYTPRDVYEKSNNGSKAIPGILGIYPSTICLEKPIIGLDAWAPHVRVDRDLETKFTLNDTWEKVFFDGMIFLEERRGIPDVNIEQDDIEGVINRLESKSSKGWCSQIALYMVAKLEAKIPVRLVSSSGFWQNDKTIRTGGHVFLEYIDIKTNRWALADPTNYILAVRNSHGVPLNAIELDRSFSLPNDMGADLLIFDIIDLKNHKINKKKFKDLDEALQREIKFYFRPLNSITYFSGNSSIYDKNLKSRVVDWLSNNRRFSFHRTDNLINAYSVRLVSFWIFFLSLVAIVVAELLFGFTRSNSLVAKPTK